MATEFTIYGTRGTHTLRTHQYRPTCCASLRSFLSRAEAESESEREREKRGITVFWVGKWKWQYEGSGLQNLALLLYVYIHVCCLLCGGRLFGGGVWCLFFACILASSVWVWTGCVCDSRVCIYHTHIHISFTWKLSNERHFFCDIFPFLLRGR